MADTTPIPAGALKLAKRLEKAARNAGANADHFATIRADDAREAARLLAGPARPDGVPDGCIPTGPDTITVNLPENVVKAYAARADWFYDDDIVRSACRAALAAAGLPQEPTEGGES